MPIENLWWRESKKEWEDIGKVWVSRNLRCATHIKDSNKETCYIITTIKDAANDVVESVKIEKTIYVYRGHDIEAKEIELIINSFGGTEITVYETTIENDAVDRELKCHVVVDADVSDVLEELSNAKNVVQLKNALRELRRRLRIASKSAAEYIASVSSL